MIRTPVAFLARLAAALAFVAAAAGLPAAHAAEGNAYPLDQLDLRKLTQMPALQNGARVFVNYCLNCHGAALMRYNRLTDLGLTEEQIKSNLLFTATKVGDPMRTAMRPEDAKEWFGAVPPDLSVIARARNTSHDTGSNYIYTYLRAYYRDATRPHGWNNAVFPNTGMPNVFWQLQGSRGATIEETKEATDAKSGKSEGFVRNVVQYNENGVRTERTEKIEGGHPHAETKIRLTQPSGGEMSPGAFDDMIADLTAYITYMSDPSARTRTRMGVWVLAFLALLFVAVWRLNAAYWKDVK